MQYSEHEMTFFWRAKNSQTCHADNHEADEVQEINANLTPLNQRHARPLFDIAAE